MHRLIPYLPNENLVCYRLRDLNKQEKIDQTRQVLDYYKNDGIHCLVLDGVGDFADSMQPLESENMVNTLLQWSTDYNCCIVTVLHFAHANGESKGRGHLGSELERKCYSALTISKNPGSDYSVLSLKLGRRTGSFTPMKIRYQPDECRFVLDGVYTQENARNESREQDLRHFFSFMKPDAPYTNKELVVGLAEFGIKEANASKKIRQAKEAGLIWKDGKTYFLVRDEN